MFDKKDCFVLMDMTLIALNRINKGESVNQVTSDINVDWLTVLGWKKTISDIELSCAKRLSMESVGERKSMKVWNTKM